LDWADFDCAVALLTKPVYEAVSAH
jgi:hypothetical protein